MVTYGSFIILLHLLIHFANSQLQQSCGTALRTSTKGKSTGKIVGGHDVGYYKYPWFASLQLDGQAWCAGTLIGPNTVVSAAHCFKSYIKKGIALEPIFKVKLGLYNNCQTNEEYQKIYNVKKVYVHEEYMKQPPFYDISLLILDGDTSVYEPACVTNTELNSTTRDPEAFIQGLGDIKFDAGKYPCALREARVLIHNDDECKHMLKNNGESDKLKHAFCAGYLEGGIDACQGDSGGPLVTVNDQHKYVLLGITSFGFGCAEKGTLGVYTDISHYLNWVERKTSLHLHANPADNQNPGKPVPVIPPSFVENPAPQTAGAGTGTPVEQQSISVPAGKPITITIEFKDKKKRKKNKTKNKKYKKRNKKEN